MTFPKPLFARTLPALVLASAAAAAALPVHAGVQHCTTPKMRGNDFVCREYPNLCNFIFIMDEANKKISRRDEDKGKLVPVVVDKWEENIIIAHEDQPRIDSRFLEQFFYKIEPASGNFLMANEYVTSKGRYLTQEDINLADPKSFGYYKPKLFSEKGRCKYKAKE